MPWLTDKLLGFRVEHSAVHPWRSTFCLAWRVSYDMTGDHSKQDLRYTQKPIYLPCFTINIWSYSRWSPVTPVDLALPVIAVKVNYSPCYALGAGRWILCATTNCRFFSYRFPFPFNLFPIFSIVSSGSAVHVSRVGFCQNTETSLC